MDEHDEIIERIRIHGLEAQLRLRELETSGLKLVIDNPDTNADDKAAAISRLKNLDDECAQIRRLLMVGNNKLGPG